MSVVSTHLATIELKRKSIKKMLKNENVNVNWKLNKQHMPERIPDLAKHVLHKKLNEKSCFVCFV